MKPKRRSKVGAKKASKLQQDSALKRRNLIAKILLACALSVNAWIIWSYWGASGTNSSRVAAAVRDALQGDMSSAEGPLRSALEKDPENIELLRALAVGLFANHRLDEADSVLTQWCTLRPEDAEPFRFRMDLRYNLAVPLPLGDERLQQQQLALDDGLHVLDLEPNDLATGKNVLLLWLAMGRFNEADMLCRKFLSDAPTEPMLQFIQARISHALGSSKDAGNTLDRLISENPQFAPALMLRAVLYYEANEADKAIPLLQRVIAEEGGSQQEANYQLGLALARAGHTEEASLKFAEVQLDNFERDHAGLDNMALRVRRAELLIQCGRDLEAKELLQTVVEVDPQVAINAAVPKPESPQPNSPLATQPTATSLPSHSARLDSDAVLNGPWFENVTQASGIDFRHFDPDTPENNILQTMGSGLGWIDYNNDGWLDLFCVQDGPLPSSPDSSSHPTNKLYRNNGDSTFTDITESVGLDNAAFGMGCAVGDCDNDGFDDLLVTHWKGVILYHNESDGDSGRHFVDITDRAGLNDPHWATSCGWGDIDGDGYLDLYVCNYAEVDLEHYPRCVHEETNVVFNCSPSMFPAVSHRLFRNQGDLTFADITESSGIADASPAPGLAVLLTDLDRDGKIDIYVANDLRPAYLFHNQGEGQFVEKALFSGCGLGSSGETVAGMGVDAADIDDTGWPSLFVTNFHFKPNMLYKNSGDLLFDYWTHRSGLGTPSVGRLGFGTVFCDANLDGQVDIAVANGHIERYAVEVNRAPYAQQAQMFIGQGAGRFQDVSGEAGAYFREPHVGRGLAWGDFDNDGKPDLAFSHNGGPIALLHNQTETTNGWLSLELVGDGKHSNRNAIGARVEIETSSHTQTRFLNGGGSYLSANDRRLLVGMGPAKQAERVTVRWPSGSEDTFLDLAGNHRWRLREGQTLPEEMVPMVNPAER